MWRIESLGKPLDARPHALRPDVPVEILRRSSLNPCHPERTNRGRLALGSQTIAHLRIPVNTFFSLDRNLLPKVTDHSIVVLRLEFVLSLTFDFAFVIVQRPKGFHGLRPFLHKWYSSWTVDRWDASGNSPIF